MDIFIGIHIFWWAVFNVSVFILTMAWAHDEKIKGWDFIKKVFQHCGITTLLYIPFVVGSYFFFKGVMNYVLYY